MAPSDKERERQRKLQAERRFSERDIYPRDVENPARRTELALNDCDWLRTYLPEVFYHDFTSDQRAIVAAIGEALRFGTSKCIAAPRGDGKSSITRYLILKYALYRQIRFGIVVCSTGPKAIQALRAIKNKLRAKEGPLWEDFPLECEVAAYVAPAPARANNVTVGGRAVQLEWGAERLILPSYAGDPIAPIIASADLAICHMETPITEPGGRYGFMGRGPYGSSLIAAPYELAGDLQRLHGMDLAAGADDLRALRTAAKAAHELPHEHGSRGRGGERRERQRDAVGISEAAPGTSPRPSLQQARGAPVLQS